MRFTEEDNCFVIHTTRKKYILKALSREEATDWISSINKRRAESIREYMGHLTTSPQVKTINMFGWQLFDQRLHKDRLLSSENGSSSSNIIYGGHDAPL